MLVMQLLQRLLFEAVDYNRLWLLEGEREREGRRGGGGLQRIIERNEGREGVRGWQSASK